MNDKIKQELAKDLYTVAATIARENEVSDSVENFIYEFFELDDRTGEITSYSLDELKDLVKEVSPLFGKADGLYERSAKNRLEKLLVSDFSNLESVYNTRANGGFDKEDMADAFKLVFSALGGI